MQAGQVAHVVEMAFNAAYSAKQPRWSIGDKYLPVGKNKSECTIVDVVRRFDENGGMVIRYISEYEFAGQTVKNHDVNETTISRGRICPQSGNIRESGE